MAEYDADLRALAIEDHELDRAPRLVHVWLGGLLALQAILVYLLLPPILVFGAIVNLAPGVALLLITRWAAKTDKDQASIKLLVGSVLFPLTWIGAGVLAGWGHSRMHERYPAIPDTFVTAGVLTALLSAIGGAVALRYLRLAREIARAIRVRLTRERRRLTIARLRVDRAELHDELVAMAADVELPGRVLEDRRVAASVPAPPPP